MVTQDPGHEFRGQLLQVEIFGDDGMRCALPHVALSGDLSHSLALVILKLSLHSCLVDCSPLGDRSTSVGIVLGVAVRLSGEAPKPETRFDSLTGHCLPMQLGAW